MLKLDDRIISNAHPYDCFSNAEIVSQYSNGWFSNNLDDFTNLDNTTFGPLTAITDSNYPFQSEKGFFKYFLPVCMVKIRSLKKEEIKFRPYTFEDFHQKVDKKKFRPYTLAEFRDKFPIEQPIKFRKKGEKKDEWFSVMTGYWNHQIEDEVITYILIGPIQYTLDELFEEYEWQESDTEEFKPFGVEA